MNKITILLKKKLLSLLFIAQAIIFGLLIRIFYIQAFEATRLQKLAYEQQTRDRLIAPERGKIYDRNMIAIATNETVASISVINAQVKNKEEVAQILSQKLDLDYESVLKKVSKKVALERIKIKVDKEIASQIRNMKLQGVVVDEDIKRIYPFSSMASQVLGFVGKDNQGIIGIEAKYDKILKGKTGKILTETDAKGIETKQSIESRIPPENGNNIVLNIDVKLQQYAEQILEKAVKAKNAKRGSIIMMNPQNGQILVMANKPDFDLNSPFEINSDELKQVWDGLDEKTKNENLNKMWRNFSINDTYEPGSTFKIITAAAGMQENVVNLDTQFVCNGHKTVGGRLIKCWRYPRNHGVQTFIEGVQNSCNPVFMEIAEDLGSEKFYSYMNIFKINEKTNVDLPGEAVGIMHKLDKVGPVELATMSFGQSFQITPLQLLRAISATINGGYLVTPHVVSTILDDDGNIIEELKYNKGNQILSDEVSQNMKKILESVVYSGTGNKAYIPGFRIGGKTATSEKLPRRSGKYIASFVTSAPAENPQVLTLVLIDEPQGVYYGGQVAGPVMKEVLENALPYLSVETRYSNEELKLDETQEILIPNFLGFDTNTAKADIKKLGLSFELVGEGSKVINQFPKDGEKTNNSTKIILYLG